MFVLSISNNIRNPDVFLLHITPNERWIYAVSNNEPLLLNFKMKLEAFTPAEYLTFFNIEVLPFNCLSEEDIINSYLDQHNYQLDRFYIQGLVNYRSRTRNLNVSYDEFTSDLWNIFEDIFRTDD